MQPLLAALDNEPSIEALTFDPARNQVSFATLGSQVKAGLDEELLRAIRTATEHWEPGDCALINGSADCLHCGKRSTKHPLRPVRIERHGTATTIARLACPTAKSFWRWKDIPWPKFVPREVALPEAEAGLEDWKAQFAAACLCAVFGLAGVMAGPRGHPMIGTGAFVLSYLAGGWFAAQESVELLLRRRIDVHFLMLAVAAGSAAIGSWTEGATLLFLFSFSGAMEHYAMGRTQREIRALFKSAPKTARLLDPTGRESEVPVDQIKTGDVLQIRPGDQIPVDAEIVEGRTSCDESTLTGESAPVEKQIGDTVLAGTMNLTGAVVATTLRPASESALEKVIHLIKEAQHRRAPAQRFTDRFGSAYTIGALALAVVMFFVWWLAMGLSPFTESAHAPSAFYRAMTLLVVASPCALVLSIPSAVLAAIAWSARRGILFRGGEAVERLAGIKVVALDKTGTLTTGELKVENVASFPPGHQDEVLQMAAALERLSSHPLARAISTHAKRRQVPVLRVEDFQSVIGQGVSARIGDVPVRLGRRSWLVDLDPGRTWPSVEEPGPGSSEVWLTAPHLIGRLVLRDEIRPQARLVLDQLRSVGIKTVVLTGDHLAAAAVLKEKLDLDDVRAELKPEQKVAAVESFVRAGTPVAMIGDGVNDAPSLAVADVGVAMGARGSDAALEQADLVLMNDRLENFWTAFRLSQRAARVIRQNLIISLGTVAVLVVCALAGVIPLTVGVIGHEGSTVIVVLNSLRLLLDPDPA